MNDTPADGQALVSVVVPTYNRAALLDQAISSVLRQDYRRWELLVIDDGSTDDTAAVLQSYAHEPRIRSFSQPNSGQAVARNRGIQKARGEFVAFLDSDNLWLPHKLGIQMAYLAAHPEVDVLYGDTEIIDIDGRVLPRASTRPRHSGVVWRQLLVDNFVNFNTSVVRTEKLREVGGMDESVRRADDYDLWLRLSTVARFQYLPGVVAQYRVAGARISDNIAGRFESNMAAVERFLASNPDLLSRTEIRAVRARIHQRFARAFSDHGQDRDAWARALAAVGLVPTHGRAWRTLAAVTLAPLRRTRRSTS
jgi:glycosyltransferase involved in cell wall biosynthesis